jgi:hypothetical protein
VEPGFGLGGIAFVCDPLHTHRDLCTPPLDLRMPPVDLHTPPLGLHTPPLDLLTAPLDLHTPPLVTAGIHNSIGRIKGNMIAGWPGSDDGGI